MYNLSLSSPLPPSPLYSLSVCLSLSHTHTHTRTPDCFYRTNNLHFALSDYQQALELDPTNWDVSCRIAVVYCELGIDHFSKGSYEKAEEQFTAALCHNPKVSRFYLCRARARNELKVGNSFPVM